MVLNFKEIVTATMVLFAVIDIIGNIPIIIGLREKAGHINSGKASIIAAVGRRVFRFLGDSILKLFGVNAHEFAVAGALILLWIALELILGVTHFTELDSRTHVATHF